MSDTPSLFDNVTVGRLKLERPLVFFDLETTGTNTAKDRIIEICMIKVYPDGSEESLHSLVNPEMHIPEESSSVHGIVDADVADKPTFKQLAKRVAAFIEDCDLGGYNCHRFDIPLLAEEFLRSSVHVDLHDRKIIDVQVIFHKREQRTLSAAYKFYCDRLLDDAHSANADTRATYEVLLGQLDRYPDLPNDVEGLDKYTERKPSVDFASRLIYNDKGEIIINFGKYKGRVASEMLQNDPGYYGWLMNGDFPLDTKHAFKTIMDELKGANPVDDTADE